MKTLKLIINIFVGIVSFVLFVFGVMFFCAGLITILAYLAGGMGYELEDGVISLIISIPFLYVGVRYFRENILGKWS